MSESSNPPPGGFPPAGGNQPPPNQPPPYQPLPNQPPYGAQPGPYAMPPQAQDPGKTLGIIGLVLSFFTALIGMIVSIVAFRSSKKAGFKNTPALAGIIIGAIGTVIGIIIAIVVIAAAAALASQCAQLGPGVHVVNGVRVTCGR